MDKDFSDLRLIKSLLDAGLYGAYLPKPDHTTLVLTIQGFKKDISNLKELIRKYVREAGGAVRCTMKEERAVRYKLCGIKSEDLPEIADKITYKI